MMTTGYTAADVAELAADCITCGSMLGLPSEIELGIEIAALAAMVGGTVADIGHEPKPRRPRRARKPTVAAALRQAAKAGHTVARVEIGDDNKIALVLGEPDDNKPTNELDEWLAKHAH